MPLSDSYSISCPYCAEVIEIAIDPSIGSQQYVEDCQVCCRPIVLTVRIGPDGLPSVDARMENE